MEKLQVRLLVFIMLGTILRCEEVAEQYPESVVILRESTPTPPLGCGTPKIPRVRFYEIKVEGNGEDVVYQRVTVTLSHLQFEMNANVSLPSNNIVECAKAAGSKGLEAFQFDGNCMGYQLTKKFLKCETGDVAIYQRTDNFADVSTVVSFFEAPYETFFSRNNDPYRKYNLSTFVETENDHPSFYRLDSFDDDDVGDDDSSVIFPENGEIIEIYFTMMDVNFCLHDGADGVPIAISYYMYDFEWPILYFFQECGKTIEVHFNFEIEMVILSHPGFGCKYYPTWLPEECTVIFKGEGQFHAYFGFFFSESDSDGAGLIMTVNATSKTSGETIIKDAYSSNEIGHLQEYDTFNFSLQRQPSTRAIGFFIDFH